MSSIMNRAAAVAILSGAASTLSMPVAAAAEPAPAHPALEVICDTLGPDTFVYAESQADRTRAAEVGWIDVTTWDPRTGGLRSHDRVFEQQPNIAVDEVCSFRLDGERGGQTVTLGLLMDGPVTLTGSDGRSAWGT